jgi:hypothetical protein
MRSYIRRLIISLAGLTFFINIHANSRAEDDTVQNAVDTRLSKIDSPTHFELYTGFLNKVSYIGRYYGTSGIGLYPTLAYKLKSGFEASVSNNVWTGFSPVFNQSEVNLGYNKSLGSWFGFGLGYARTFMYYGTDSDKMAMPNALNLNLGLYLSWANIGVDYSYMFGYDKASALHFVMSKDFSIYKFLGSDKVTISPGVGGYWAPQTVFYHYFSKNTVKKINRGNQGKSGKGQGSNTATFSESSLIQPLDYQLNLPIDYHTGHFAFELALHVDFPVNLPVDYLYGTGPLTTFTAYLKYIF